MIEQVLVGRLLAWPTVTAIVGDRVAPVVLRQATSEPVLVYRRLYGQRKYGLLGSANWVETQVQVTCWAPSYSVARGLADAVCEALDGWGSDEGDAGPLVHLVSVEDGADEYAEGYEMLGATVLVTVRHEED